MSVAFRCRTTTVWRVAWVRSVAIISHNFLLHRTERKGSAPFNFLPLMRISTVEITPYLLFSFLSLPGQWELNTLTVVGATIKQTAVVKKGRRVFWSGSKGISTNQLWKDELDRYRVIVSPIPDFRV